MKSFRISSLALALSALVGSSFAAAQDYRDDYRGDRRGPDGYRTDIAQVVRVQRIVDPYATYQRQECWNERTRSHESGYYRDSSGRLYRRDDYGYRRDDGDDGAVVGAVVGGALGNQVGDGRGRTAATIAGALIGASVGRDIDRNNDGYYRYNRDGGTVVRCRNITVHDDNSWRRDGFHVTYRYGGQTYQTMTMRHPGRTLRVMVSVRPVDDGYARR